MKRRQLLFFLLLICCACFIPSKQALAGYSQFYVNYCTWYAAQKFDQTAPSPKCNWRGNAWEWITEAAAKGWRIGRDPRDAVRGAVIVWEGGGYGHVAYVENVHSSGINISEMNWGLLSPPGNHDGITTNFGKITTANLPFTNLNRGSYRFIGYVLPSLNIPPPANNRPYPLFAPDAIPQGGFNTDGTISILVRGADNAIWHIRQTAPNAGWLEWESLGGNVAGDPMVGRNKDGRLEFFVRGHNGNIYSRWQTSPGGGWGWEWYNHGGGLIGNPAVGINEDDRLQFYAIGTDGAIWTKWQQSPSGNWSAWQSFGGSSLQRDPAIGINANRKQELFVRGGDGQTYFRWQWEINGGWDVWRSHGGNVAGKPVIGRYSNGSLAITARGHDGIIYYKRHDAPNGNWTGWAVLGRAFSVASNAAVVTNAQGIPQVFVRGHDNQVYTLPLNAGNSSWLNLGGNIRSEPCVVINDDGRMQIIAQNTEGRMLQRWQLASGGWSAWAELR